MILIEKRKWFCLEFDDETWPEENIQKGLQENEDEDGQLMHK